MSLDFGRLWRHLFTDRTDIDRMLDRAALDRLERQVAASEAGHTGEIRLCVEAALPWRYLREGATPRQRAVAMFSKLQVWDTEGNNGVLVHLLLADRAIEVVADRALHRRIPEADWQALVAAMAPHLREGCHEAALQAAIATLDAWLRQHFPVDGRHANPDELPNRADIR